MGTPRGSKSDCVFRRLAPDEMDRLRPLFPDSDELWQRYRAMRRQQFRRGQIHVYVVQCGDTLVGEISATTVSHTLPSEAIPNQRAYLQAFRVAEPYQGMGLGQALLQFALADLERRGYSEFTIGVEEDNAPARHIYTKLGFVDPIDRGRGDAFDPTDYILLLRRS